MPHAVVVSPARWSAGRAGVCVALLATLASVTPAPARADSPIGLTRPVPKGEPSKACIAAGRKLTREQQSLDDARADLDRYTKARATCATKSACARNDDRIASLQKRIPRYVARLNTFHANQDAACKTG